MTSQAHKYRSKSAVFLRKTEGARRATQVTRFRQEGQA